MATEHSGNTIPSCKCRAWQLTLNRVESWTFLLDYIWNTRKDSQKEKSYIIACREKAPTTGHEHIHCYVHYGTPVKFSMKKLFGAHVEVCRGSPKQNIDYIRKDGDVIFEEGVEPHQGVAHTLDELVELDRGSVDPRMINIYDREIANRDAQRGFEEMLDEVYDNKLKRPDVIYVTGPPGNGKTYHGIQITKDLGFQKTDIAILTLNSGFGVLSGCQHNPKAVVIAEFRDSQISASDFLQLTDAYGHQLNVKGGFKWLRPQLIVICSVIDPSNLYSKASEVNTQFLRRITKVHLMGPNHTVSEMSVQDFLQHQRWAEDSIDLGDQTASAVVH